MGLANVFPNGEFSGVWYVDSEDYTVYENCAGEDILQALGRDLSGDELRSGEWICDDLGTTFEFEFLIEQFSNAFSRKFKDFAPANFHISREERAILESPLFFICARDNCWSTAIELVQKDVEEDEDIQAQADLHTGYLEGIKTALLELLPSIYRRTGAYTSERVTAS